MQNLKNSKTSVLIVSTVRNCGKNLLKTVEALDDYLGSTNKQFLFVESDSSDDTLAFLQKLATSRSNFKYLSLGDLKSSIPRRTERIAFCRNKYLEYLHANAARFEYLIVVDSDGVVSKIEDSNVFSIPDNNWYALAANVNGFYYDLWALRAESWCNHDCWKRYRDLIGIGMSEYSAYKISVWSSMISLNQSGPNLNVNSAFGGLAVYKVNSIPKSARYIGVDSEGGEICEHVSFNLAIKSNNLSSGMYILPGLIVGKSPPEHVKYAGASGLLYYRLRRFFKLQFQKFLVSTTRRSRI